jgi:hypothetical protein
MQLLSRTPVKALLGAAAATLVTSASPSGSAREVRTTFSFVVTIDDRVWPYNDEATQDVPVLLPLGSPWQCVRQKLVLPSDGMARGTIECSSDAGKTRISVSAACGFEDGEQHNTVTLAGAGLAVRVSANCRTSVYAGEARVAFPTLEWDGF